VEGRESTKLRAAAVKETTQTGNVARFRGKAGSDGPPLGDVPAEPLRVLVADADCVFASSLIAELARVEDGVRVVGLACEAGGVGALAVAGAPDLILLGWVDTSAHDTFTDMLRACADTPIVALVDVPFGLNADHHAGVAGFMPRRHVVAIAESIVEVARLVRAEFRRPPSR
jgi:hypothetical protein